MENNEEIPTKEEIDLKGWQIVNEMKDWLKEQMKNSKNLSIEFSTAFVIYGKIQEIEMRVRNEM